MKAIQLRTYQTNAIEAIKEALCRNQQHIVVEMAAGCGKRIILARTLDILNKQKWGKILIVTGNMLLKEQLECDLSTNFEDFVQVDKDNVLIETEHKLLQHQDEKLKDIEVVVFYEAAMPRSIYEVLSCKEKTVIVFTTINQELSNKLFTPKEVVFSYGYKDAVNDGYLTPAMDTRALGPAVEAFSKQLLKHLGCEQIELAVSQRDQSWDLVIQKDTHKIWVECKAYKSQVVSPSTASSLLNGIVLRKNKQKIPQKDFVLLLVFSQIPSFQKNEIYKRHRIIVWDIENLVFYSHSNLSLLKQLSQITYFPIDTIKGCPSEEVELAGLHFEMSQKQVDHETKSDDSKTRELIQRLKECEEKEGQWRAYEDVCEEILRSLLESDYFNRLIRQHKTNDERFRMDMIGSLKINQRNEESMHPLWRMLVQHYNTHFVVFEFKNYAKKIDQNVIYVTEKYLFDTALRNVAFIISPNGFSDNAKFAAEGCLKEHGKLILDITDKDLISMIESKDGNAADYLLIKLEEFLMGISK